MNMLITHIFMWGLVGNLVLAQIIGPEHTESDNLRYNCGQELAQIAEGPLFFHDGILFTSVISDNGHPLLILQTDAGVYAAELGVGSINRVELKLPLLAGSDAVTKVYVSYYHDGRALRRTFEFSIVVAPFGKDASDFKPTRVSSAPYLKPHLDYLLLEHADKLALEMKGRVRPEAVRECSKLADRTPSFLRMSLYRLAGSPAGSSAVTATRGLASVQN
jgi:hypothetical protein